MKMKYRLDKGQIEAVDDAMADVLRRKTPAERMAIGFHLWAFAREMLMVNLKRKYPDMPCSKKRLKNLRRKRKFLNVII